MTTAPAGDPAADEADLVARLHRGDAAAARELYERHGAALLRFGLAMSNCRQTAEDVVHDTFVELLRRPTGFDPGRGSVVGYLFGIARHRMARVARVSVRHSELGASTLGDNAPVQAEAGPRAARAPGSTARSDHVDNEPAGLGARSLGDTREVDVYSPSDDAGDALDRERSITRVRLAVFDLPHVHREVVALCDLEELPYATVASILGCPIGTVRSRLSRARALLATRLEPADESEPEERPAVLAGAALHVDTAAVPLPCRGTVYD